MARILILTSDLVSIVNSHTEVARRLRAAGHTVVHLQAGVDLADLQGRSWDVRDDARPSRSTPSAARAEAIERLGLEAHRRELIARSPDLVLVDIERHEDVAVALTLGVPVALTSSWIAPGHARGLPPLDVAAPAPDGLGDRLRNELTWLRRRVTRQRPRLQAWLRSGGADRYSVLSAFTRRHGVSYRSVTTTDAWLRPWGYRRLRTLVLAPAELDLATDPAVTYLGAMVGPADDAPLPEAVDAAIRRHRSAPEPGLLLYCSFGSFPISYTGGLVSEVIAAVATRPSWTLVLSVGGTCDPASLGELPDNVVVERWVPQRALLGEVDLAVTHAGLMTLAECAVAGVPVVVYSAGLRDQDGNSARVVHHGLGELGSRDDAATVIRDRIERCSSDAGIRDRVSAMRQALSRDDRILERAVADLLAGR